METSFDDTYCRDCEVSHGIEWLDDEKRGVARTRYLNDQMRRSLVEGKIEQYGMLILSADVGAEGEEFIQNAIRAVAGFDTFDADNDPYGEHDFGAFEVEGKKLFFKVDYYDTDLEAHSPDKSDPARTTRVLTLMFRHEY